MVLRKEDGTPVFHGAAYYLPGGGDQVELRQRKWHTKIAVVVVKQCDRLLKRIRRFARICTLEHHTDIDAVYFPMDTLEVSDA
jgi:hypothetical protein